MKKALMIVYLVYTVLRLFTATVHMQREEDPTIILKYVPTCETEFLGSDSKIAEYSSKY